MNRRWLFLFILVFFLVPHRVWAEIPGIEVFPNRFSFSLNNGQSRSSTFMVRNYGSEPVKVSLEATLPSRADLSLQEQLQRDWIRISPTDMELEPGMAVPVTFTIVLPEYVKETDLVGGIVARAETEQFVIEKGATILVDVFDNGTEQLKLQWFRAITPIAFTNSRFSVRIDNIGTTFAKPHGSILITDLNGEIKSELPIHTQTILVGERWEDTFSTKLPIGMYYAYLDLKYAQDIRRLQDKTILLVIPSAYIFFVAMLPVIFIAYRRFKWKRKRKHSSRSVS